MPQHRPTCGATAPRSVVMVPRGNGKTAEIKRVVREAKAAGLEVAMVGRDTCKHCQAPLLTPPATGRRRLYCSDLCRVKANRKAKKEGAG